MRLAYLYSRYPVLSQTFCDTEMIELERRGYQLLIGSIHPPLTSIRHAHAARLKAPIRYAPPSPILRVWEDKTKASGRWPTQLVEEHERKYGARFKAELRARNACYFAQLFARENIRHFHVHFANRAAHTALFLKAIAGIPFSLTAHGQDFMSDLGNDDLLREICAAAEFVAVETDYSRELLAARCPDSAVKIHRVYNGMNLENFPRTAEAPKNSGPTPILSVGRLVPFKGFEFLIDACAKLKDRGAQFTCEIVGDGPLRQALQTKISENELESFVTLSGALPQQAVFENLRRCDVFALASVIDPAGASDVFPTVILEAMASSRPVVSTTTAGIPEAVVDGSTGFLVPAGESELLANALEKIVREPDLGIAFGNAGRARVEENFQSATTIAPLVGLLATLPLELPPSSVKPSDIAGIKHVAYVIDKWPDAELPLLEMELAEMARRNVSVTAFVCHTETDVRLSEALKELAPRLVFLPDPLVIEAEWQTHRALAHELEDDRANSEHRVPAGLFLEEARYAVALCSMLKEGHISHVHATNSRALVCGLMLKKILGVTLSATIESHPKPSWAFIQSALAQCEGGRLKNSKLSKHLSSSFLLEPRGSSKLLRGWSGKGGIDLKGHAELWEKWSSLLVRWR